MPCAFLLGGVLLASLAAGAAVSFLVSQVRPTFHDGRSLGDIVQRPLLGMVSTVPSSALTRRRWRGALLFAGGFGGLLLTCGATIAFTYLGAR
jgi:hypothetical protein